MSLSNHQPCPGNTRTTDVHRKASRLCVVPPSHLLYPSQPASEPAGAHWHPIPPGISSLCKQRNRHNCVALVDRHTVRTGHVCKTTHAVTRAASEHKAPMTGRENKTYLLVPLAGNSASQITVIRNTVKAIQPRPTPIRASQDTCGVLMRRCTPLVDECSHNHTAP